MPPAPSPKREGEAKLLGFVVFCFWFFASALTNNLMNFRSPPLPIAIGRGKGRGWGYFIKIPFVVNTSFPTVSLATTKPLKFISIVESSFKAMVLLISFWPETL